MPFDVQAACWEKFRLKAEYIERLSAFNRAAAAHTAVLRAGLRGQGAVVRSWRVFQDTCAESRAAWQNYRRHLASHSCNPAPATAD
jgi:hypothetical protein